ncbi:MULTISPECIES: TetR/AcrR family transcriptional regulator [Streptomyces]|uniref:AcrR family transcriptional regulator n=2 Tax=Streptomyces TaxID=1883 RepID=A0A514JXY9_9ACTN|nr:TetR/AcrR family transcriptional regulator [Streptomyces calvus]MYS27722.1 TetR family transcriptional regulator [Streptomyces sp. SID7804]MBA8947488.1 AcrR family transcriptional regulator [Streptomyces calvus]MBA8973870.1 AcrR family transcriptional regulator [Streptomyces calvus]QDI72203.1 TetR family transcriptional regulator [Streptomyces calvus]GGP78057.1 TetR family transcriptional regulator [Streptomyces calvus]
MNIPQPAVRPAARGTARSSVRRAELIAIGRRLFADTSYDALSMDDIARQARVAKGLIYYYFRSKRGYYLAIIEDSVAGLVALAASGSELPPAERVHRTVDSCLRYAEHNQAAYRAIVSGGVGSDAEVHAVRDGVREAIVTTIAEGAWGRRDIAPVARMGLLAWVCSVEGAALDWIDRGEPTRETMCELLVKTLGGALRAIEELDPAHPAPAPAHRAD